jgi:hypothetical protein
MRRDLPDIVDMYSGYILGLPTNATRGLVMAPQLAGKAAFVNVGFDGPRAVFSRVRADGDKYDKVIAGIRAFQQAGLPVSLSAVVLRSTLPRPDQSMIGPTCSCRSATCWRNPSPPRPGAARTKVSSYRPGDPAGAAGAAGRVASGAKTGCIMKLILLVTCVARTGRAAPVPARPAGGTPRAWAAVGRAAAWAWICVVLTRVCSSRSRPPLPAAARPALAR